MANDWAATLGLLIPFVLLTTVASEQLRKRRNRLRLRSRLHADFSRGVDLTPITLELIRAVSTLSAHRSREPGYRNATHLRLLRAVAAIEQLDLATARAMLDASSGHPAKQWVRARLLLLEGETPPFRLRRQHAVTSLLGAAIVEDTRAQLALARGDAEDGLREYPRAFGVTRARILAALGREDDALLLLRPLAESRIEAMCRSFPADPATRAWLRDVQARGPYR